MNNLKRKITWFIFEFTAVLAVVGVMTAAILWTLAVLFPLPAGTLAHDLRFGVGMMVAIVIGLRISRWLERRWGGD